MRPSILSLVAPAAFFLAAGAAQAQSTSFQGSYDNSGNGITSLTGAFRNSAEYPNNASERGGSSTGGFSLFSFGGSEDTRFLPPPNAPTALRVETDALPPVETCTRRARSGRCLR